MRSVFALAMAAALAAANLATAQTTSAPPAAAPATPAPAAPSAPATGAPAFAPTPGTPSPGGVTQMPSPSINSTPSQSNVDLYPPTRVLPNPAPARERLIRPRRARYHLAELHRDARRRARHREVAPTIAILSAATWTIATSYGVHNHLSANRIGRERASAIKPDSKSRSSRHSALADPRC
jgi:hypothetical protein